MKPFNSLFIVSLCALAAAFVLPSCETLDNFDESMDKTDAPKDNAAYTITIHEIVKYPRGLDIEKEIPSFANTTVVVNGNPFLHSKNIPKIDIIEEKDKPGFYDLSLTLDRRGRMLWTQLSINYKNLQVAMVVDGVFYKAFTPEALEDDNDTVVVIKGPIDAGTAMSLKKNSERNYKLFNKKD